jgi:glycosyltransferase involved in cell wall biosynthesis
MQFSLIIPAKNAEKTIFATLMSVINQADVEYEVIVIDDHSTDETRAIVLHFAKQNDKIRYYISSGNGVSAARNLGVKKAFGEYLIFIDADDQLESDALYNIALHIRSSHHTPVVFSGYKRVSETNEVIKPFSYEYAEGSGKLILPLYLNKKSYTHLGAFCFKREFIVKNQLFFKDFDYAEDIVFVSQALFFSNSVSCLRKETYRWTLRQGSVLYSNTLNKFNGLKALSYLHGFLKQEQCTDAHTYNAVGNHYAMLLLDTVTSLLWMGRSVNEIASAVETNVDWDILPDFVNQSKKVKRGLFLLKHFRLPYLKYCKKHYVPYNFRKKGIKTYER